MGLQAARHLLTHPSEPARYVCASATSACYEASGGGGYDTHTDNATDTAMNFDNVLRTLLAIMNAPGETDPAKLDLDDTLIILNTEFGRTPCEPGRRQRPQPPPVRLRHRVHRAARSTPREAGIHGAIGRDGSRDVCGDARRRTGSRRCSRSASGRSRPRRSRCPTCAARDTEEHAASSVTNDVLGVIAL